MPRLEKALPKLSRHKDQACIYLGGRRIYLGKFGSQAAQQNFDRAVAEWLASGRTAPQRPHETTVNEVLLAYIRHAKQYYRKGGKTTNEVVLIKDPLQHVKALYGNTVADSFGPLALECVRDYMIEYGWARTNINKQVLPYIHD